MILLLACVILYERLYSTDYRTSSLMLSWLFAAGTHTYSRAHADADLVAISGETGLAKYCTAFSEKYMQKFSGTYFNSMKEIVIGTSIGKPA